MATTPTTTTTTPRRDQLSERGDAILWHAKNYGRTTDATIAVAMDRLMDIILAITVAVNEPLWQVKVFAAIVIVYQTICLCIQFGTEERANPSASTYEFASLNGEAIKAFLAGLACWSYLIFLVWAIYIDAKWGLIGLVSFIFCPLQMDYRINAFNRGESYYSNIGQSKTTILVAEIVTTLAFAISESSSDGSWLVIAFPIVVDLLELMHGVRSKSSPGACSIQAKKEEGEIKVTVLISINATEADLSYAGFLVAFFGWDVVYIAEGDASADIPKMLKWITFAGLPPAGSWGEVLGEGCSKNGADLQVEVLKDESIIYELETSPPTRIIKLGDQTFLIDDNGIIGQPYPINEDTIATPVPGRVRSEKSKNTESEDDKKQSDAADISTSMSEEEGFVTVVSNHEAGEASADSKKKKKKKTKRKKKKGSVGCEETLIAMEEGGASPPQNSD